MAGDVDVPKVGKVPRKALIGIVGGAGAFLAYRYWKSRQAVGSGDETADAGYEDGGVLPSVAGAVRDDNLYGSGSPEPSTDSYGFNGKTNDEWTQYVATQLSQGERWEYTEIVSALGRFLTGVPLTDADQEIVRAAIAIGGQPPVGAHPIVGGGNVPITVAPSGVRASATPTTVTVNFNPVAGASQYYVYRSNSTNTTQVPHTAGGSSPLTISGLTPGTAYTVQVAAVSSSGKVGPKSSPVSVKTPAVAMTKAAKPSVTAVTASSAHVTTGKITHATSYQWYLNGRFVAATDNPAWTPTNQHPKTKYAVRVRADSSTGAPGPLSDTAYYTTKSK